MIPKSARRPHEAFTPSIEEMAKHVLAAGRPDRTTETGHSGFSCFPEREVSRIIRK